MLTNAQFHSFWKCDKGKLMYASWLSNYTHVLLVRYIINDFWCSMGYDLEEFRNELWRLCFAFERLYCVFNNHKVVHICHCVIGSNLSPFFRVFARKMCSSFVLDCSGTRFSDSGRNTYMLSTHHFLQIAIIHEVRARHWNYSHYKHIDEKH